MNDEIITALGKAMQNDSELKRLARRVARGDADYTIVGEYSERVGELLSKILGRAVRPVGIVTQEFAEALLRPSLTASHGIIADVVESVQNNMNESNGIGLAPAIPALDTNRIDGFISKITGLPGEEAERALGEPVVNYAQAIADQAVRDNAKRISKAGIDSWIVRVPEKAQTVTRRQVVRSKKGKAYTYMRTYQEPCKWCSQLAGRYRYRDVKDSGNDVYRRHEFCRCMVIFESGRKRQDTRSKIEWTSEDATESRNGIARARAELERDYEQRQEDARYRREHAEEIAKEKQRRAEKRISNLQYIQKNLRYSAKSASIYLNQHQREIELKGIDYVVQRTLNTGY